MAVTDLSIYSRAQATGVLASALFVGGNIVAYFSAMPNLKTLSNHLDRITLFTHLRNSSRNIMIPLIIATASSFSAAAYYAPTDRLRNSMIVSAVLAASIGPYTPLVIAATEKKIAGIESEKDSVRAAGEGQELLDKWSKLGLVRCVLMAIACLNGLKELSDSALI